ETLFLEGGEIRAVVFVIEVGGCRASLHHVVVVEAASIDFLVRVLCLPHNSANACRRILGPVVVLLDDHQAVLISMDRLWWRMELPRNAVSIRARHRMNHVIDPVVIPSRYLCAPKYILCLYEKLVLPEGPLQHVSRRCVAHVAIKKHSLSSYTPHGAGLIGEAVASVARLVLEFVELVAELDRVPRGVCQSFQLSTHIGLFGGTEGRIERTWVRAAIGVGVRISLSVCESRPFRFRHDPCRVAVCLESVRDRQGVRLISKVVV